MIDQGRTFQSRTSSRADAKEAAAKAPASKQREKGLWNFLTWSFFISHIVAAQQVIAASAMAAEAAADSASHAGAQSADAPLAAAAAELGGFERAEIQQTLSLQAQTLDPGAPTLVALADQAPMRVDAEAFDDAAAHGMPRGQTTLTDLAEKSLAPDGGQTIDVSLPEQPLMQVLEPVTDAVGSVVHVVETVLEPLIPPVIGVVGDIIDALDPTLTPVGDLVGNVVASLDPILDQVASPVAGLAGGVIELVEPILDPIIMPTVAVLEEVLQSLDPVIDPVTGIAAGATALLGEAIEPVTALVGDAVEPLVPLVNDLTAPLGEVISPLLAPLGSVLAPITAPLLGPIADGISLLDPLTGQGSESAGGSVEQPLSALLGLGSGGDPILIGPVGAAAGSLDLPALPVVSGIDELFSGGSYTDYNLALQTGTNVGAQPLAAGAAALDTLVSGIESIALLQQENANTGGDAPASALPNLLDSGALRGLEWVGL